MSDYVIPCHKSSVHPDGVCRKKLHKNIGSGLHRLAERHQQEEYEEAMKQQLDQIGQQRAELDLQEKMLGVGMGTHRVMKETRKNPPRVTPVVPGKDPSKKTKGK